jgi:hypothetical protein
MQALYALHATRSKSPTFSEHSNFVIPSTFLQQLQQQLSRCRPPPTGASAALNLPLRNGLPRETPLNLYLLVPLTQLPLNYKPRPLLLRAMAHLDAVPHLPRR